MTKPTSKSVSDAQSARLVVTAGEPAGIGPELCLALAGTPLAERVVIVADPRTLARRAEQIGKPCRLVTYDPNSADGPLDRDSIRVWPIELPHPEVCGRPHADNSAPLLDGLTAAVRACERGEFAALATAPLQKSAILDAGIPFTGHTEFLAEATGGGQPVMLLVAGELRVGLATTHLPLSQVPQHITEDRIVSTVRILHDDLKQRFGITDPKIVVCGLNPHAGEGGHLGDEDDRVIAPAVAICREAGIAARGPVPADTAFTPAAGPADAVLAMYHDQGLPVLKYAGFGHAVNVTLGLPIVRTSVDHGTALDIAGTGRASTESLVAAIELAATLARR